jgi:hypothetical protein
VAAVPAGVSPGHSMRKGRTPSPSAGGAGLHPPAPGPLDPEIDPGNPGRPGHEGRLVELVDAERTGAGRVGLIGVRADHLQIRRPAERQQHVA